MSESSTLAQISAYMPKNRIKATLEVESQQNMVVEAIVVEANNIEEFGKGKVPDNHKLDCI